MGIVLHPVPTRGCWLRLSPSSQSSHLRCSLCAGRQGQTTHHVGHRDVLLQMSPDSLSPPKNCCSSTGCRVLYHLYFHSVMKTSIEVRYGHILGCMQRRGNPNKLLVLVLLTYFLKYVTYPHAGLLCLHDVAKTASNQESCGP